MSSISQHAILSTSSAATNGKLPAIEAAQSEQKVRWRGGYRAFRALIANPDDTAKAQDIFMALGAREFEKQFQRFLASPTAPALLAERPLLVDVLSDRSALESLPDGSFGRAYLDYMQRNDFRAESLLALQRETQARWEAAEGDPPQDEIRAWFADRNLMTHDLLHVVTDYETDGVGEATLLAFNLAQVPGRASLFLTFGAGFEIWRNFGSPWLPYVYRAWKRGRRAVWLSAIRWEELLGLPLSTLRARLLIEESVVTHPGGLLRGESFHDIHFEPAA